MRLWLLAALAGALLAVLQYGHTARTSRGAPLAALRALAALLVVALLLDAPAGPARRVAPDVLLDGSESWTRASAGCPAWGRALDSARAGAGGNRLRFGDSVRADAGGGPLDRSSALRPVADRAAGSGRPVIVITDGELDDADVLRELPRGSRTIVIACDPGPDAAVSALEAPAVLLTGDTVTARVTVAAGGAGAPAGRLALRLDDAPIAVIQRPALAPYGEQTFAMRGVAAGAGRSAVLRATLATPGDREPRNDTLGSGVDVSRAPAAVFVSTSPDYDAREAVSALRGVTSLPTRAYYRVAPGAWRAEGTLAPVAESEVRAALRDAPLAMLHGDTAMFGPPRAGTRGALLLFAPPADDDGEWFAAAAPPSPVSAVMGGLPFDSLPPLSVAASLPRGQWEGLTARRGGAPEERRAALVGWDEPRRVAVLGASGFWRWRFRGGARADAYGAFFGSLFDWLAAGRTDRRAVVPPGDVVRAGTPIRWRRGAGADSVVTITITRRAATGRVLTVPLRFGAGDMLAESPALAPGVYDVRAPGGSSVLVVNASRELIPRRPTVRSGTVGSAAALGDPPRLREVGWLYVVAVGLLCAEWLLRRRLGLR